jgi:octaprenyl-diphosphate synthase
MVKNMRYSEIRQPISLHLNNIDNLIAKHCESDIQTLKNMCEHLFSSQGKRIRPSLVLLTAYSFENGVTPDHEKLAAIIELIHAATLLHDDVLDKSEQRRGKIAHHKIWGNHQTILLGDYIYSLAFKIIAEIKHPQITSILANASCQIVKSELHQSASRTQINLSETEYFNIIQGKTAQLFSAAMEASAYLHTPNNSETWKQAGLALGMAYQLTDDCLDYSPNNKNLGKNHGDDWNTGTPTLPIIKAYHYANSTEKTFLEVFFSNPSPKNFETICQQPYLEQGLADCKQLVNNYLNEFKSKIKSIDQNTQSLIQLADLIQDRQY